MLRLVKPERNSKNRAAHRERWWRYGEHRPGLYRAIEELERIIAIARVSKAVVPTFVSPHQVLSEQIIVFATEDAADLALLSSAAHYWWVILHSSTFGVGAAPRYTPTDVFETLARPDQDGRLRRVGERLHTHRARLMAERGEGLTKTYNRVHDSKEHATDIVELRDIHVEIDNAVAEAYGWTDLTLDHDFYQTRQGIRYTVGPVVRQVILDRLLQLNFDRYAEEVAHGLHAKRPSRGGPTKSVPRLGDDTDTLF